MSAKLAFEKIPFSSISPPIFLLHTIPFDSVYLKKSLANVNFTQDLYLIDLPNHGNSPDLELESLTIERITDTINGLRQDLELDKIIMYGHGIGGFVAQEFTLKYEKFLEALIISNSSPNAKYRKEMAWNIRDKYSNIVKQSLDDYVGKTDDQSLRARFTQSLAAHFDPINHDLAKDIMDQAHRIATAAYVHLSATLIEKHDLREKLRNVKVRTFLVGGKNDVWPTSAMQFLKNDLPHARLLFFDTGHFPMIEDPILYWNTIKSWLSGELNEI